MTDAISRIISMQEGRRDAISNGQTMQVRMALASFLRWTSRRKDVRALECLFTVQTCHFDFTQPLFRNFYQTLNSAAPPRRRRGPGAPRRPPELRNFLIDKCNFNGQKRAI